MRRERQRVFAFGLFVAAITIPTAASANPFDISLRGLGRPPNNAALDHPTVLRYKNLSSELAFALASRPLAPAETLGISGFEFSLASTTADINDQADYWQGQPGSPVFEGVLPSHGSRGVPTAFWVPTVHLRKGLPMSSEIGITGSYLAWSEMTMLSVEGKVALHESYFRWAPAISARGAVGRLFGSSDLDLMTIEVDGLASLPFGVGGMAQITPYAGYGWLFADVNSHVLDETPYKVNDEGVPAADREQKGGERGSLYTFPRLMWSDNSHGRLFVGLRVNVAMIEILYELDVGFLGGRAGNLQSHSFKIGFDV